MGSLKRLTPLEVGLGMALEDMLKWHRVVRAEAPLIPSPLGIDRAWEEQMAFNRRVAQQAEADELIREKIAAEAYDVDDEGDDDE